MDRFKRAYRKMAYSSATYELMNHLTLRIQDPDIRLEFDKGRCENFARLYRPCIFVVVANLIVRLALYLWTPATTDYYQLPHTASHEYALLHATTTTT